MMDEYCGQGNLGGWFTARLGALQQVCHRLNTMFMKVGNSPS